VRRNHRSEQMPDLWVARLQSVARETGAHQGEYLAR
jgi:hypothetical protein